MARYKHIDTMPRFLAVGRAVEILLLGTKHREAGASWVYTEKEGDIASNYARSFTSQRGNLLTLAAVKITAKI
jgi:hypothetical protein